MTVIYFTIILLEMLTKMVQIEIFSGMIDLGVTYYYSNFRHKVSEVWIIYF